MVRVRAKIEENIFYGRALARIKAKKEEKQLSLVGIWLKKRQITEKKPFWWSFGKDKVRNREYTHFGKALVRVRAKIEKNNHCGTTLVRIMSKI